MVTSGKAPLELVVDAGNYVGESPWWSPEEKALYWVNVEDPPELLRWDAATGERKVWPMPSRIGGFVLKSVGGMLVILADGLYDMDLETGALELRVATPLGPHAALHEGMCDREGRFWVGSIDHGVSPTNLPGGGSFFRLDGDRLVEVDSGISCSNGLAFSPDGRTLYHTDAPTRVVHAYTLDPATGALSDKRIFARVAPEDGYVDGATVDCEGGYWAAMVFGSKLRRYAPDGRIDVDIELPFNAPTKPAFGGEDLATLYLTTTRLMPQGPGQEMLGGLYALRPGVRGLPETKFRF